MTQLPPAPALPAHGRYAYSAITSRPVYDWPEGKRLAVYLGVNLEHDRQHYAVSPGGIVTVGKGVRIEK